MKIFNKFSKAVLALTLFTTIYIVCSAHFIWIETPGMAAIGKEHLVNLFFGEINFKQYEISGGRLDEMDGLKAIYINPKNEEKELTLTKQKDRFITKFTPESAGIYQVLTINSVARVMDLRKSNLGIVKPMYYARQIILCDNKTNSDNLKSAAIKPYFDLDLIPDFSNSKLNTFSTNQTINFYSYFKKSPVKGGKIFAHAPNGWSKEIDANDKGLCTFTPLWEGQYVIDWVYSENTAGTFHDKQYESIRHRAVLTINVVK
ncbi:MAG: DUF4198 domain-containing protein [Bacteroidota bacterium]|nr:DUF4198 domain-containing protein [Bacteroidota bacterium]